MSSHPRRTVRSLVFRYVAALGLITISLAGAGYLYTRSTLTRQLDARLEARMAMLLDDYARGGRAALVDLVEALNRQGARNISYQLLDADGSSIIGVSLPLAVEPGWSDHEVRDPDDDGAIDPVHVLTRRLEDGSMLSVMADRDYIEKFDGALVAYLVTAFGLIVLLALLGGVAFERVVRGRLVGIDLTARALLAGDTHRRVAVSSRNDEFDALAGTINTMLDRMDTLLGEVRRVSAYIAHDLRAPLARLRTTLVHGLERGTSGEALVRAAVEQCDDLLRVFAAILQIGDVSANGIARWRKPLDLSALMAELVEAYTILAEESGHRLSSAILPGVVAPIDRTSIEQALINLLENALHHTPAGTAVHVTLDRSGDAAMIEIADAGHSISAEDRAAMLAGHRLAGDSPTSREALGLRLVQAIVAAHQGTIVARDNDPGVAFVIALPLALPDTPTKEALEPRIDPA